VELSQIRPDAYYDAVIFDMFEQAREELDRRAEQQQPFGVPLIAPMSTPDPNAPIIPTPRLPSTRAPAGFVTETPVPTTTPTGGSTVTGDVTETPQEDGTRAPLTPQTGPITGGG
jgi:hypothetical protein